MVLDSFGDFSPQLADDRARPSSTSTGSTRPCAPGKRGGAFCSYTVPSAAPYVMLNYTARRRDVLDARARARPRRPRGARAAAGRVPLRHAADARRDRERVRRDARVRPAARRGADAGLAARAARREHRGLDRDGVPPDRDEPLRGPRAHRAPRRGRAVARPHRRPVGASRRRRCSATPSRSPRATARWWSYVPHFINTPGYVYAYAYGQLLALAVYGRYEEEGEDFAPAYLELLAAGGSLPPEELGEIVGIDLADPGFWDARARPRRAPARGGRGRPRASAGADLGRPGRPRQHAAPVPGGDALELRLA